MTSVPLTLCYCANLLCANNFCSAFAKTLPGSQVAEETLTNTESIKWVCIYVAKGVYPWVTDRSCVWALWIGVPKPSASAWVGESSVVIGMS